jgi:2-(1,2-epoxy-1,2-dihydrophenyl)acetyl-CoA isomerase
MSIALACDIRVGAESAFITTGFRNVGLSGDYGGTWLLTQLVGPALAKLWWVGGHLLR